MFGRIGNFFGEVKTELAKVSWSTRRELIGATTVVIVVTFILAGFIYVVDLGFSKLLQTVLR